MASTTNTNPILEKLIDGKVYDLEFGDTWNTVNDGNSSKFAYHTVNYDFKPASVCKTEQAELAVGANQDVSITLTNVEGSTTQSTKYSGNTKPYSQKECMMIIDPQTGKIVLERLSATIRVKNVRVENRPATQSIKSTVPRPNPNEHPTEKKLPKQTTTQNPIKPIANAPVKPMTDKQQSLANDRLSDEESSPDVQPTVHAAPPVSINPVINSTSILTSLEEDLQLSDSEEEDDDN